MLNQSLLFRILPVRDFLVGGMGIEKIIVIFGFGLISLHKEYKGESNELTPQYFGIVLDL
jgi:hypothetical protein